ncbi:MAG: baseplate J/gp47 family protein [Chloroflexota bacterium]|nr:baseplate J/gp47 family protein [Chloroflexota bacterium]
MKNHQIHDMPRMLAARYAQGYEGEEEAEEQETIHDMPRMLAARYAQGYEGEEEAEEQETIHVYPVEGGGLLFTRTPLEEGDGQEQEEDQETTIDSEATQPEVPPSETPDPAAPAREEKRLYALHIVLLVLLFFALDNADPALASLFTPTVTVTITPTVQNITLHSTAPGKRLHPVTLRENETVPATGHGHQDATRATGTLTFYNAAFTPRTVAAGTVFTGNDGVQVVTDSTVTIAANNPPSDGIAQVPAHAVQTGAQTNIPLLDINGVFVDGLYAKNRTAFAGGQDARDYKVITQADQDGAAVTLRAKLTPAMDAALQGQLRPSEQMLRVPCSPALATDHRIGQEAAQLHATLLETCTAIAYDPQMLRETAQQRLTAQAPEGYKLYADVRVTQVQATGQGSVSFTSQASYVYQVNEQGLKALIAGKPRATALRLLAGLPGIHTASMSGIEENQPLPDPGHIQVHILLVVS